MTDRMQQETIQQIPPSPARSAQPWRHYPGWPFLLLTIVIIALTTGAILATLRDPHALEAIRLQTLDPLQAAQMSSPGDNDSVLDKDSRLRVQRARAALGTPALRQALWIGLVGLLSLGLNLAILALLRQRQQLAMTMRLHATERQQTEETGHQMASRSWSYIATGSSPPLAATDGAHLDLTELAAFVGDDPEILAALLADFQHSAAQDIKTLRQAESRADWKTLTATASHLQAAALTIGAPRLGEYCQRLEQMSAQQDLTPLREALGRIEMQVSAVLAEIGQLPRTGSPEAIAQEEIALDETILIRLIGDDPALRTELFADFWDAAEQGMTEMDTAMIAEDWNMIGAVAHRLKSAARSIGALPLGECAERLEQAGKAGDGLAIVAEIERFKTHLSAVLAAIETQPDFHV